MKKVYVSKKTLTVLAKNGKLYKTPGEAQKWIDGYRKLTEELNETTGSHYPLDEFIVAEAYDNVNGAFAGYVLN